jgi:aromatic-L-amino-acid decarboxylase
VRGLQQHIRRHVGLAQEFKQWVKDSAEFELAVDNPLTLICFYHRAGDEVTEKIMRKVNQSGQMYLTHTRLRDRFTLRMSIGQTRTERKHVENAWRQLQEAGKAIAVG